MKAVLYRVMRVRTLSLFSSPSKLGFVDIVKVQLARFLLPRCKDLSTPLQVSPTLLAVSPGRLTFRTPLMDAGSMGALRLCFNSVQRALHGLYLAWEQRLLFTVGTSMTTGQSNCVTWNDIHLKTNRTGPDHSYPDPNFLANLMQVPHISFAWQGFCKF